MRSFFPDVNVWIALSYRGHTHHESARNWLVRIEERVCFCRFTQMGFLRLLTHSAVMGADVRSQQDAWRTYDLLLNDDRIFFQPEPDDYAIEASFRTLASSPQPAPHAWSDAYLAAFCKVGGHILVTFDRGLHRNSVGGVLLS
jgi:uncharacterized protein